MKIFTQSFIACMAVICLFIASCSKEESTPTDNNNNTTVTPMMSAKVDGTAWTTSAVTVMEQGSTLVINANSGSSTIALHLSPKPTATGNATVLQAIYTSTGGSLFTSLFTTDAEKVTITKLTENEIQGTFEFKAAPTFGSSDIRTITEGTFTAKLK